MNVINTVFVVLFMKSFIIININILELKLYPKNILLQDGETFLCSLIIHSIVILTMMSYVYQI